MFKYIDDKFINLNAVRFAEQLNSRSMKIIFLDGQTLVLPGNAFQSFVESQFCIVPAPAGYTAVECATDESGNEVFVVSPVLAFKYAEEHRDLMIPITIEGQLQSGFCVVEPSGRAYDNFGSYDSVDDWKRQRSASSQL